jgi:hypothetical protein
LTLFFTVVFSVWALMHLFVGWNWQRLGVPAAWLWPAFILLWASYPVARWREWHWLEYLAANWMGILFLQFALLLVVGVINLGGVYWPFLQRYAVIVAGILAGMALVQGLRPPVVRDYDVALPGLPRELRLVAVSDLHLGSLIGQRWAERLITRINALQPDIVCVVGDLVDGNVDHVEDLLPTLQQLRAPLGVYAVTGNHEYYAGVERSVKLLEQAGYTVLRDRWTEVTPGLVMAGIDDLTARPTRLPENALANRPVGATVLLSHTPAKLPVSGVGLQLAGHTHNGQLWPFNYLVRLRHDLIGGRYDVGGMTVLVSRGAGTWGPRMRLWWPGEILQIRLHATP